MRYDLLSSGNPDIDQIAGGGIIRGRVAELYGDEGGGKTSLALSMIAQTQLPAVYFDIDRTFPEYIAEERGIANQTYVFPGRREPGEYAKALDEFSPGSVGIVVFDPVAVLGGRGTIDLTSVMVRAAKRLNAVVLVINHCDLMYRSTGHSALSRYAAQRFEVRFLREVKKSGTIVGMDVACMCTKTTIAPARGRCQLFIPFHGGEA